MSKNDGGTIDLESLRGHTPGPWLVEYFHNEGNYGDGGPDCRSGFKSYQVTDEEGRVLFDTLNSGVAVVHEEFYEEFYEEGKSAWDEQGRKNIALARAAPDLLAELTARRARDADVVALVAAAKRANGDHTAPHDCYATGPSTGDDDLDLVSCPGCELAAALLPFAGDKT